MIFKKLTVRMICRERVFNSFDPIELKSIYLNFSVQNSTHLNFKDLNYMTFLWLGHHLFRTYGIRALYINMF